MKAKSNNTSATFIEDHSTYYETGKMKNIFLSQSHRYPPITPYLDPPKYNK